MLITRQAGFIFISTINIFNLEKQCMNCCNNDYLEIMVMLSPTYDQAAASKLVHPTGAVTYAGNCGRGTLMSAQSIAYVIVDDPLTHFIAAREATYFPEIAFYRFVDCAINIPGCNNRGCYNIGLAFCFSACELPCRRGGSPRCAGGGRFDSLFYRDPSEMVKAKEKKGKQEKREKGLQDEFCCECIGADDQAGRGTDATDEVGDDVSIEDWSDVQHTQVFEQQLLFFYIFFNLVLIYCVENWYSQSHQNRWCSCVIEVVTRDSETMLLIRWASY